MAEAQPPEGLTPGAGVSFKLLDITSTPAQEETDHELDPMALSAKLGPLSERVSSEEESESEPVPPRPPRDRKPFGVVVTMEKGIFGIVHMMVKGNLLFAKLGIIMAVLDFLRTILL
jgi:hypothetical protein